MRAILLGAVALAFTTTVASADVMTTRIGNTTITKDAAGNENHIYYKGDGTFTAKAGTTAASGTWKIDGGNICLTFAQAVPGTPNPACAPISEHKVGDTWTAGPYTVSLVAGIP